MKPALFNEKFIVECAMGPEGSAAMTAYDLLEEYLALDVTTLRDLSRNAMHPEVRARAAEALDVYIKMQTARTTRNAPYELSILLLSGDSRALRGARADAIAFNLGR